MKSIILRLILSLLSLLLYKPLVYLLTPLTLYPIYFFLSSYNPIIQNNSILINSTALILTEPCLAILAYLLLLFLTIITPKIILKTRIKMFFLGSLLILLANLIRILILSLLIINNNIESFISLHLFLWKFVSSIYVLLIWIFLTNLYKIKTIPIYTDIKYLIKIISTSYK
jgi:exosortase/archaeosortase family protein